MRFFRLDDDHPFTGWHMAAVVFAFFSAIIAVNVAMAIAATGTFPGLVVENSYVASQHYDELLAKAHAQDEAGWHYDLSVEGGVIHVALSREGSVPARGLDVVAHVGRPSTTREDEVLALKPASDGAYVSPDAIRPGLWEIDISAERQGELIFRRTQEVYVQRGAEP